MNNLEDSLETGISMFSVMLLAGVCETYRPIIESELEKKLGRKMTNEEWHYFLQECYEKAKADLQQERFRRWSQHLSDRKIIHDFVWHNN